MKRIPLTEKKTRQQFEARVNKSLSSSVFTIEQVRGSTRRQRSYILAYGFVHRGEAEAGGGAAAAKEFVDIEKMAKLQRAHCSAAYQDAAYKRSLEMV